MILRSDLSNTLANCLRSTCRADAMGSVADPAGIVLLLKPKGTTEKLPSGAHTIQKVRLAQEHMLLSIVVQNLRKQLLDC